MTVLFELVVTCVYLLCITSNCITITIDITNKSGPTLIDEFLSVTIDAAMAKHWGILDLQDTKVNTLAAGLGPAYFRYGGTSGDETVYDTNGTITNTQDWPTQTLNMTQLSQLIDFASRNNWTFVFALDAQERYSNNTWDPTNSIGLMTNVVNSNKYSTNTPLIYGYELGNEPDIYQYKQMPYNVTAKQLATDFNTLYDVINNNIYSKSNYKPFIWGCDTSDTRSTEFEYLAKFANNSNPNIVNSLTWHHYYGAGKYMNISTFISPQVLDELIPVIQNILQIQKSAPYHFPVILGETSSGYNGGTQNLSASFVAGFMWLDKLGLCSVYGIKLVARQAFSCPNYCLIGEYDWDPNPDYYSSYIFKNLVGNKVLWVNGQFELNRYLRVYAFCTKMDNNIKNYGNGSVTLIIMNLNNNTVEIDLDLKDVDDNNNNIYYDEYLLTHYDNVLNSRSIYLNKVLLELPNNTSLPKMVPNTKPFGSTINMDAISYGYVVVANANSKACLSSS